MSPAGSISPVEPKSLSGVRCRTSASGRGRKRCSRRGRHDIPSMVSHPAVPLALASLLPQALCSPSVLCLGVMCAVLPDLDVVGFRFGVSYGHFLAHRALSSSSAFAVFLSAGLAWLLPIEAQARV
jgi:LexA-binding, inner membrane-associated putative hydrolase